jgi:hypothetical protein
VKYGLFALLLAAFTNTASATTVHLISYLLPGDPGYQIFNQTAQNPCVIGDNPCGGGPIPFTAIGNDSSYDVYSPIYTASQITNIVGGSTFILGLDLNNNANPQTITAVEMLISGTSVNNILTNPTDLYQWAGSISLKAAANGSGHSDMLFQTFDLTGFAANTQVQFHLVMPTATPGAESLFLINNGDLVAPEPSTFGLAGASFVALAAIRRRRKRP